MDSQENSNLKQVFKNDGWFLLVLAFFVYFIFTGGLKDKEIKEYSEQDLERAVSKEYSKEYKFGYELGRSAYYNGLEDYACIEYTGDIFAGCEDGYLQAKYDD